MSTITNWLWNIAVVMWTPPMHHSLGGLGPFLFFGVVNVCFFFIIRLLYGETQGRVLKEIDIIFAEAYTYNEWNVKVGNEMPSLSMDEVSAKRSSGDLLGIWSIE